MNKTASERINPKQELVNYDKFLHLYRYEIIKKSTARFSRGTPLLDCASGNGYEAELLSDYVFVGSEHLKQYALQFTDNVAKIPTGADIERYTPKSIYGQTPVIGWMGTSASLKYLMPMENVFSGLNQKGFDFSVKIVCNQPFHFKSVKTTNKRWSLEDEIEDLKRFDIGIMPMPDDEFTRAKYGFKMIQYMAVGIPAVCSAVGENVTIGQGQDSCFLVHNEQQWIGKLSVLLADSRLQRTVGQRSRRVVEARYTVAKSAQRVIKIIRSL